MSVLNVDQEAVAHFEAKTRFEISPARAHDAVERGDAVVIDVRERAAYDAERIPGALSFPLDELERRLPELPRDKTIIVYCWHIACTLGPKACLLLARNGLRVQEMTGGLEQHKKKLPTQSGK